MIDLFLNSPVARLLALLVLFAISTLAFSRLLQFALARLDLRRQVKDIGTQSRALESAGGSIQARDESAWAQLAQALDAQDTLVFASAILGMLHQNLGGCGPTQHLLGNLTVQIGPKGVSSRTSVRASHRGSGSLHSETYECMGYYKDQWQQTPEGWRILHREMVVKLEFGSRKVLGPKVESD